MAVMACAGWVCWDERLRVAEFPPSHSRTRIVSRQEGIGGMSAVAALTIASLGGEVVFYGVLGEDAIAQRITGAWAEYGVQPACTVHPEFVTPVNTILVSPEGERFIFRMPSTPPKNLDWALGKHDFLLLDLRLQEHALTLAQQAKNHNICLILDMDEHTPLAWDIAALCDHVLASEELVSECGGVDAFFRRFRPEQQVAVTLGAKGVQTPHLHLPAFDIEVLDSTGAGDVFHGAYLYALAQRKNTTEALSFASAASAVRCQTAKIPTLAATLHLLEEQS